MSDHPKLCEAYTVLATRTSRWFADEVITWARDLRPEAPSEAMAAVVAVCTLQHGPLWAAPEARKVCRQLTPNTSRARQP